MQPIRATTGVDIAAAFGAVCILGAIAMLSKTAGLLAIGLLCLVFAIIYRRDHP